MFVALVALLLLSPKVHCLCNVIFCIAINQERLQGSFSQTDMKTLIYIYIYVCVCVCVYIYIYFFCVKVLKSYKLLKEGLGTHAASHETVHW
jgi:hypothetical protein